jgi:SAM-dependent methyltransferase
MPSPIHDKKLFYDSIALDWDSFMNNYDLERRLQVIFNEFLKDLSLQQKKVLDAGCGTGWFSKWSIDRKGKVTSLDIGLNLLQLVKKRVGSQGICGDALRLPFQDSTFDFVISSELIEHTSFPLSCVGELIRVLKPGGYLLLTCPNRFWYWSCWLANLLKMRPYEGIENWVGWWELKKKLKSEPVVLLQMRGIHLFPFVIKPLNFLLKKLDKLGKFAGPFYVNIAVKVQKN